MSIARSLAYKCNHSTDVETCVANVTTVNAQRHVHREVDSSYKKLRSPYFSAVAVPVLKVTDSKERNSEYRAFDDEMAARSNNADKD